MATADEQAARNREIVIAKANGDDLNTIAARHHLSPARVRQILARGTAILLDAGALDPVQIALERRAQYEHVYEEARALFERTPDTNPSSQVGALKLTLATLDRLSAWDRTIGLIPEAPNSAYRQLTFQEFTEMLWDAMQEADIPEDTIRRLLEIVRRGR